MIILAILILASTAITGIWFIFKNNESLGFIILILFLIELLISGFINAKISEDKLHIKYKNGPVKEMTLSKLNCDRYSYYDEIFYKCNTGYIQLMK